MALSKHTILKIKTESIKAYGKYLIYNWIKGIMAVFLKVLNFQLFFLVISFVKSNNFCMFSNIAHSQRASYCESRLDCIGFLRFSIVTNYQTISLIWAWVYY
ncbi:MAG: hypothetical protein RIQ70_217 [Bacteroidota bacterium]